MKHRAPGKAHREGMSLAELLRLFPDDATAERWFREQRWGDQPYCPHCAARPTCGKITVTRP